MNGCPQRLVIIRITAKFGRLGRLFLYTEILTLAFQQGDQSNNEHSES